MNEEHWFDELEWEHYVYEVVDDEGVKNGQTVEIWEAVYGEQGNVLVIEDYGGNFVTWCGMVWENNPTPTMIYGRALQETSDQVVKFNSVDYAKKVIKKWIQDGCPVQRWTKHTAQRRTWKESLRAE